MYSVSRIDIKTILWNLSGFIYFQFFFIHFAYQNFRLKKTKNSSYLPPRPRRWRAVAPRQGYDTLAPSVPGDPQGPGFHEVIYIYIYYIWMFPKIGVPPKSSILIGFSIINHPIWGTPIFGNTHIYIIDCLSRIFGREYFLV